MKCPKCEKEMIIEIKESPSKLNSGEDFLRTVHHCEECNIYVGVYLPLIKN